MAAFHTLKKYHGPKTPLAWSLFAAAIAGAIGIKKLLNRLCPEMSDKKAENIGIGVMVVLLVVYFFFIKKALGS